MKRLGALLVLGLAACLPAIGQGVIIFNVNWGTNPPPHTLGVPDSGGRLTNDLFSAAIYLSALTPSSGRIAEKDAGGSLVTVFPLTNLVFAAYPPPATGPAYSYEQTWQLTGAQIQSLMAGDWYAEVSYGGQSYAGQFGAVPEPSILALFASGATVVAAALRKRVRRHG